MNEQVNTNEQNSQREPIRFLLFAASLRKDSLNLQLVQLAAHIMEKNGGKVDLVNMSAFDCPSYNQDVEQKGALPAGAEQFRKRLLANDAFIIASPEYNASMPGHLKNVIDWVSRFRPQPFNERHALLMSASPSMVGGNRGLWSLRIPLEHLGARVFPDMFSLATAHQAFTQEGNLSNTTLAERFENNLVAFMNLVEAAKHYPCIKKAWVEFLGEKPDPVTERIE
ncbi:MAG: NAD(P)H-dependent oxidoreductase [Flavisolibacter sp.]|nr:NAD(P)H-dependent oxidoreductase [Flavisolibacter sp.]